MQERGQEVYLNDSTVTKGCRSRAGPWAVFYNESKKTEVVNWQVGMVVLLFFSFFLSFLAPPPTSINLPSQVKALFTTH